MNNSRENCWLPNLANILKIRDLGPELKLIQVQLTNSSNQNFVPYHPGQFAFVSAFGVGEAPFGIASITSEDGILEFAIQRLGSVTNALHELAIGDYVGVRGPLGNSFPMEKFEGKNILVIGGGIGGAPLRPVIQHIQKNREDFGALTILWAARTPDLLMFREDYEAWRSIPDTALHLTVDQGSEDWDGREGLITELLKAVHPGVENTIVITCGPPIMIYFVDKLLGEMGFDPENRYVTLEARMHCGIGKCGRCNIGEKLVCVDGPVFSMDEVEGFLEGYY